MEAPARAKPASERGRLPFLADLESIRFAEPLFLWLLVGPAVLGLLWLWQVLRRRHDARRWARQRQLPVKERFTLLGDLGFWLFLLIASSLCIGALARPQARVWTVSKGGGDFVILQDGSSSMYVSDVDPDRWQRSVRFLREFAESLSWKGDRVALALFASLPAPQVRLTNDPNALFFFLDHLGDRSPFRLEDINTWDTNIEEGVFWGLQLFERDTKVFGPNSNPRAFVVISDGQAWSGNVALALKLARERDIPVHVVGVGTRSGGMIPEVVAEETAKGSDRVSPRAIRMSDIRATLDRDSLRTIAREGGGEYYELDTDSDRDIAFRIISSVRRRAPVAQQEESLEDLHWRFLAAAAFALAIGALLLKRRPELVWLGAAAFAMMVYLLSR